MRAILVLTLALVLPGCSGPETAAVEPPAACLAPAPYDERQRASFTATWSENPPMYGGGGVWDPVVPTPHKASSMQLTMTWEQRDPRAGILQLEVRDGPNVLGVVEGPSPLLLDVPVAEYASADEPRFAARPASSRTTGLPANAILTEQPVEYHLTVRYAC